MLLESKKVSQEDVGYRRFFFDDYFDLFIWYSAIGEEILGFELCYDKQKNEHSIIWDNNVGYIHSGIDSGENNPGRYKKSPVLISDGNFDRVSIAEKFKENETNIDPEIFRLVYDKITQYRD